MPAESSSTHYPEHLPHGPYLDKSFPDVYQALNATNAQVLKHYRAVDLPADLVELVLVRVSQINSCPACLSVHVPKALRAGASQAKIDVLAAWRESEGFSSAERAALDLAETITLLPAGERKAAAPLQAMEVFTEDQVAALEWAIILINTYNRVSIFSGHPPLSNL